MRAGQLRHRVTIQTPGGSASAFGEVAETWSTVATVWAAVEPLKSEERRENDQGKTFTSHRVLLRYRDDVTTAERLQFDGRVLNIASVVNDKEKGVMLELACIEVSA